MRIYFEWILLSFLIPLAQVILQKWIRNGMIAAVVAVLAFWLIDTRSQASNSSVIKSADENVPKALLASRFNSLIDFKKKITVQYFADNQLSDSASHLNNKVGLEYKENGVSCFCTLEKGISQQDISDAAAGSLAQKISLMIQSPFSVRNRKELMQIFMLARRRVALFGAGDVAFFDLAEATVLNINTPEMAYLNAKDSSEKGFLNTFNHVTAQAIVTAIYSVETAHFVGNVHELHNMPELTTGLFTIEQLENPDNNPVDNYVDIINNHLGEKLGYQLGKKLGITPHTKWTPTLLAEFLNELQGYYCWSFQIGMKPFSNDDDLVIRYAEKINKVLGEELSLKHL